MPSGSCAVTGAGRGIGRSIALAVAEAGHPVALQARTLPDLLETRRAIEEKGGRAVAIQGDVTRPEAADDLLNGAETMAPLAIAVACAGQAYSAPFLKTRAEDLSQLFLVNVVATFHLLRAAAARMIATGTRGRLIAVGSTASVRGARYTSAYSASKHALLGMVRSAAIELAPKGITVNVLCPGWVDTPMFDQTLANISAKTGVSLEEARAGIEKTIPTGVVLKPDEVAAALRYLISDGAAQVTGQALVIDGGSVL